MSTIKNKLYERRIRKKIKNDNFSIICSTCIGGIIYHRLGKQFLSPTIDLWFNQKEFIRFASDLKKYLDAELVFVKGIKDYPVAYLHDVRVFFMHYSSENQAREAWERRKRRINYDNLYIILNDIDGITEEDIIKLRDIKCSNIVVLSNKNHCGLEYVQPILTKGRFTDKDKYGIRTYEKQWDYVAWLNSEKKP